MANTAVIFYDHLWSVAAIALYIIFLLLLFLFGVARRHPIHIEPSVMWHLPLIHFWKTLCE
uniref:ATP synthase F0 subunit 8 n=1 Tax=Romanomermis culicivorax TaxID=13658 RepID=A0A915IH41_ROMCU